MRIIAGYLKGRIFDSPRGHRTHPMSDKIRGALFNILGDIQGLDVLDAFAGSGAIALEAVSRGATSVMLIESDRTAQQTIAANITRLEATSRATLITASVDSWLKRSDDTFDVVIMDPPYDDYQPATLRTLADRAKPEGIVALSLPTATLLNLPSNYQLLSLKTYGDAYLHLYRRHRS